MSEQRRAQQDELTAELGDVAQIAQWILPARDLRQIGRDQRGGQEDRRLTVTEARRLCAPPLQQLEEAGVFCVRVVSVKPLAM